MVGVGARSEILRHFVLTPLAISAAGAFADAHYTKRIISEELESLRLAGLLEVMRNKNQRVYRLARGREFLAVTGDLPSYFPRWSLLLDLIFRITTLGQDACTLSPVLRAVEAKRLVRALRENLMHLGVAAPSEAVVGEAFWDEFARWALTLVLAVASGADPRTAHTHQATRPHAVRLPPAVNG